MVCSYDYLAWMKDIGALVGKLCPSHTWKLFCLLTFRRYFFSLKTNLDQSSCFLVIGN